MMATTSKRRRAQIFRRVQSCICRWNRNSLIEMLGDEGLDQTLLSGDGRRGSLPWLGLHRNQLRALGPMCCALTPACNRRWGGTEAVDLALSLELAYSNRPCPQVRRAITVPASTSALGTSAAVEGKGPGAANHSKINMLVCKAILGVSLLSDPAEHPLWSFNFLAGMSPAESAPK